MAVSDNVLCVIISPYLREEAHEKLYYNIFYLVVTVETTKSCTSSDCKRSLASPNNSGCGFSKDFSKVMTILANEVIIAGHIGPAINM